jgi:glucose-1-phosphate cytidylyltransferase
MKAVILCGGKGTRIKDVSEILPKPMVPIGDMPILWHIMKSFSHYGVNEFILCLGYKAWHVKEFFINYKTFRHDFTVDLANGHVSLLDDMNSESEWKITLADTGEDTMTGGRVRRVKKYLEGEDLFLVTYGDGLANINIKELIAFHRNHGRIGTITATNPSSRFGEIAFEESLVTHFNEKPSVGSGWINGGFMVFDNKRFWDYLWPDDNLILERETLPALVKDKQLGVFKHEGFWLGMDTPREYSLLNELWSKGNAPWKVWS